jgi:hypothetical protein
MSEEQKVLVNIHDSYRWVVAICDEELLGRTLKEDIRKLDLTGLFFKGKTMNKEETLKEIERCTYEDATFNIVGTKATTIAKEAGIINEEGIMTIEGIPYALVLV